METNDIQGNIVAGFNTCFEAFVALALRQDADPVRAARWIGTLSSRVSTVDEIRASRGMMKDPSLGVSPWLAVAISKRVIDAVQPSVLLDDINFNAGMAIRKTAIGDETPPAGWVVGGPNHVVDLLLIVAANDLSSVEASADDLVEQAGAAGLEVTYRETGTRLPKEIEHFGFKDGVSQPEIAGDRSPTGFQPGHFIFGYPKIAGGTPIVNQQDPLGLTRNGSLLVFRRLVQDVAAFHAFFDSESARLLPQWPGLTAKHLAALVVGRWPSGAPVSIGVAEDPGSGASDNAFDFHDDLEAARCPFGAHIRKVNPRQGNRDVVDVPRILRRGIPFGPPFAGAEEAERGLLFVAYQSSLKAQFVFISGSWMNRPDLPQSGGGFDLLVGRASSSRSLPIKGPAGAVTVTFDQSNWIKPTGGAYLFAPGQNGLAMLSQPSSPQHFLAAARALAVSENLQLEDGAKDEEPSERDGRLTAFRVGTIQTVERAYWPLTRLTSEGAARLSALRELRHLDLAGEHFPTQILGAPHVEKLAAKRGLEQLSVHAAALPANVLRTALADLPLLAELDLRGLDVGDDDVAAILLAHPDLTTLSLGATTNDRGPHHFHSGRLSADVLQALRPLRSLRSLSLRGLPVDDASLAASIQLLTSLEEFDAGETKIGDEIVRRLAPPARLRRLWLDRTRVTDQGILPFAESTHLGDLDVSQTAVTGSAIDSLLTKTGLSRLAASNLHHISDTSLPSVSEANSLAYLDLAGTGIGDRTVAAIALLPLLEQLSIASTNVTARGFEALASSAVQKLNAGSVNAEALTALLRMRRLRELKIDFPENDWTPLTAFEGHLSMRAPTPRGGPLPKGLQELRLRGALQPDLCRNLSRLPHLQTIWIEQGAENFAEMDEDGFATLRTVVADGAGLDDSALDLLGRVPNLEALFISGNAISASVVRLVAPHLHTLELRDTSVDDRVIEALARLPRLHCLDLPGTNVTADGIAALVPSARNLQSLALDGRQLTTRVASVLADSPTMVEIYLYGAAVTDEVLARLAPVLRLRELNLSGTAITDNAATVLIAWRGLRTVSISGSSHSRAFVTRLRSARPDMQLSVEPDPGFAGGRSRAFP